jgi:hypothetical protein
LKVSAINVIFFNYIEDMFEIESANVGGSDHRDTGDGVPFLQAVADPERFGRIRILALINGPF